MTAMLVLAAGGSRRLGAPKQLVAYEGQSLVERAVRAAQPVGTVYVVLGAHADAIVRALVPCAVNVVMNPSWELGLGSSLAAGVRAVRADGHDQVVVLTCDQPHVTTAHLAALNAALNPALIAASAYEGVVGVPAAFAAPTFDELAAASGDHGARAVLRRDRSRVHPVAFARGAIDVDRPEDVAALVR